MRLLAIVPAFLATKEILLKARSWHSWSHKKKATFNLVSVGFVIAMYLLAFNADSREAFYVFSGLAIAGMLFGGYVGVSRMVAMHQSGKW